MAETQNPNPSAARWHQLGVSAARAKSYDAALDFMHRAIAGNPHDAVVFNDCGIVLKALRRFGESQACFERAIALAPRYALAHSNLGNLLRELRHGPEALLSYQRALAADPQCADAHANLGVLLLDLARWEEAIAHFDRALAQRRGDAHILCNRGVAFERQGKLAEALESYERALASSPDFARVHANRGNVLCQLRELEAALEACERAVALSPELAAAHQNRGLVLLTLGRLREGWREYEWRLKNEALGGARPSTLPRCSGVETLQGRCVFIPSEQGLGDTLQFARYALLLKDRGAHVILEAPAPLQPLLASWSGVTVIAPGEQVPDCDGYCPLMSLPFAFDTTLATIPAAVPYVSADPDRIRAWGERLGPKHMPRVGLVWSGGHRPNQPEVWSVDRRRNLPIRHLAHLKSVPAEFISLQKGQPAEGELDALQRAGWDGPPIRNFVEHLHDFAETAALLTHLDLLVSVDTSTAHLAGALAKPVWILNRHDACWRWLDGRRDSPWYPTATLYRQAQPGDWEGVMRQVATDLQGVF